MANSEKWIAVLRQMTTGHHSKARQIWEGLNQNQRGLILHAAGMKSLFCRYCWDDFSDRELLRIKRGIQRLKALAEMFDGVAAIAFQQPAKPAICRPAPRPHEAVTQVDALIEARQQLRKIAASRTH